jgi:CRISPR-associated protein Csm2
MSKQFQTNSGFQQGRQSGYPPRQENTFNLEEYKSQIKNWIKNKVDKDSVKFANGFGEHIAKSGLTTSQIRIVFGEMRRIQMNEYINEKTAFILLKPKLAYAVKRHNSRGLTDFYKFFEIAYDIVDTNDDNTGSIHFENLMNLTEAILAYHKYYGGRE